MVDPFIQWLRDGLARKGHGAQSDLARELQIAPAQVNRATKGGRDIKAREIDRIAKFLGELPPLECLYPDTSLDRAMDEMKATDDERREALDAARGAVYMARMRKTGRIAAEDVSQIKDTAIALKPLPGEETEPPARPEKARRA